MGVARVSILPAQLDISDEVVVARLSTMKLSRSRLDEPVGPALSLAAKKEKQQFNSTRKKNTINYQ